MTPGSPISAVPARANAGNPLQRASAMPDCETSMEHLRLRAGREVGQRGSPRRHFARIPHPDPKRYARYHTATNKPSSLWMRAFVFVQTDNLRPMSRFSWQFRYREPHQKREAEFGRLPVRAPDRRLGGQCQDFHGNFVIGNRTKNVKRSSCVWEPDLRVQKGPSEGDGLFCGNVIYP